MIDTGLLATLFIMLVIPSRLIPTTIEDPTHRSVLDLALGPLVIGLLAGRAVALAIDDPSSLFRLSDFMVIRSGAEFWPGVAAGMAALAIGAHRDGVGMPLRMSVVAVPGLVSWSVFEVTCIVRDGCPGPVSPVGLRPAGLHSTMVPVGILVGVAGLAVAFALHRTHDRIGPLATVVTSVFAIAALRSTASFFLPHVGDGITRQHLASLLVAGATGGVLIAERTRSRLRGAPG